MTKAKPKTSCFYAQPTCSSSLTKEHVISASVLKAVFGKPIRNIIGAEFLGTKNLYDHEPIVRDVCQQCNNVYLSPYDAAGMDLINQLMPSHDPTGLRLFLRSEALGWIVKTHLNYIRVIKDRETNEVYPISEQLRSALIRHTALQESLFKLLIEGWVGEPYFWDANDPRRIPWFGYSSVRFPTQRVVISDFRIKTLATWLVIPSDADYHSFDSRVNSVLTETRQRFGFDLQPVDVSRSTTLGYVDLTHVLPLESVNQLVLPTIKGVGMSLPGFRRHSATEKGSGVFS